MICIHLNMTKKLTINPSILKDLELLVTWTEDRLDVAVESTGVQRDSRALDSFR